MENVIDIAKDEQIKFDIEAMEKRTIDYIDILELDFDGNDNAGTFILGVTFSSVD